MLGGALARDGDAGREGERGAVGPECLTCTLLGRPSPPLAAAAAKAELRSLYCVRAYSRRKGCSSAWAAVMRVTGSTSKHLRAQTLRDGAELSRARRREKAREGAREPSRRAWRIAVHPPTGSAPLAPAHGGKGG